MPKNDWGKKLLPSRKYKLILFCLWLVIRGVCVLCRD